MPLRGNTPHVLRETGELCGCGARYMAVVCRVKGGKPHAMVAVGIGAELVLYHVHLEYRFLPILSMPFSAMAESHMRLDRAA